jgi:3-oxoacyl-[acyl-carrier protein] reductase
VNNAGVFDFCPLGEITPGHFHKLFDINVLGVILATQEALKHFNPAGGSIINTSSVVARDSPATSSVYNATKSAVDALTRTFSKELGERNIRVNSINPGPIETDGVHAQGLAEVFHHLGEQTSLGRVGQPGDIAPGVVFLASDEAAWMTGETLHINGGVK